MKFKTIIKRIKTGFLNRNKKYLTCFLLNFTILTGNAQLKQFGEITFEFNEVTHQMFLSDLQFFSENANSYDEKIKYFAAILPYIDPVFTNNSIHPDFRFLSLYNFYQTHYLNIDKTENGIFWGLTQKDAQEFNLEISTQIDDRKYLPAATNAFIDKFKKKAEINKNSALVLFYLLADSEIVNQLNPHWNSNYIYIDHPNYRSIIRFLAFKEYFEDNYLAVAARNNQVYYEFKSGGNETLSSLEDLLQLDIMKLVIENQWLQSGKIPEEHHVSMIVSLDKYYDIKKKDASRVMDETFELDFPVISLNESLTKGKGGFFYTINNLPGIQAEMGDRFINLVYKAGISAEKFLKYNDLKPTDDIIPGEIYYLKTKKSKADIPFHIIKPYETLWSVSQKYGIRLNSLLKLNRMDAVTKPTPGLLLWIREKRPKNTPAEYIPILMPKIYRKEEKPFEEIKTLKPIVPVATVESIEVEESIFILKNSSKPYAIDANTPERAALNKYVETINYKEIKPKFQVHSVKKGETLEMISKKYGVSISTLKSLNNLLNTQIEDGDKLIIRKN